MTRRRCPECGNKLPYAAQGCAHCGWQAATTSPPVRRIRRRRLLIAAVALLAALGLTLYAAPQLNAAALADLYARFAFNYLPARFSSFAPGESAAGAYFYCAKSVVRKVKDGRSVETFPSVAESETAALSEGRYRVTSYVDQASDSGETSRHRFVCTVRYSGGHWMLEELALTDAGPAAHPVAER